MSYRKKYKYSTTIAKPSGIGWKSIHGSQVWISKLAISDVMDDRNSIKIKTPSLYGTGSSIVRSALNFMMQLVYPSHQKYHIDWIVRIDQGLSREVFRADVIFQQNGIEQIERFAVGIILNDAPEMVDRRIIKEQVLLQSIYKHVQFYSVPKPIGIIWQDGLLVTMTTFVLGHSIDFRTAKSRQKKPWEIVAKVAAETHKIPKSQLPTTIRYFPYWHDHIISEMNEFRKFSAVPQINCALSWIQDNLPESKASVLVHSDLLGQNILETLDEEIYLIDWEYSFIGSPAYDLAIVTRGVKNPFKVSGGLDRLIDAYLQCGGQQVTKKDVHIHEILLNLGWYEISLDRTRGGHAPEYYLEALERLLNRASKGG